MKTILRIIMILLVAAVVAGAFSLAVNNSSTASSSSTGEQPPAMASNNQSTTQMARPEGGNHESGSITQGLAEVTTTLMKLTGISILVLLLQKGFSQLGKRKLKFAQR
jgi:hypothetical protein